MLHLPAMQFPGGDPGIIALPDTRPDVIGVSADYWLAETNTTYGLWNAVYVWAVENGYGFAMPGRMGTEADDARMNPQHPVTLVDWVSAAVWCNALTELHNLETGGTLIPVYEHEGKVLRKPVVRKDAESITANPDADGFRLPTGLEWELAARFSTAKKDESYAEYPPGSGRYWSSFLSVSGELEYLESRGAAGGNVEYGSIVSRPVQDLERNDLGFTGFAGKDGKLWQWCYEFMFYRDLRQDGFSLKLGGSRTPRCGRHEAWPRKKVMNETCNGFDQITFRVARNAGPAVGRTDGYARLDSSAGLSAYEGRRVEIRGRVSDTPWQHLIGNPEGYGYSYYFDTDDGQIVVYTRTPLDCAGGLTVRGTVIRVQGSSKRPGSKADESYIEFHIAADGWECG